MKFSELGLNEQLLEAISYMSFSTATPVQEQAIPQIIKKRDLIACAQTGTGKTAAFLLPALNAILDGKGGNGIKALIMVPTRELAIQIDRQIEAIAYSTEISSLPIYGGGDGSEWNQQKKALKGGVDIVIATPGKLISHLNMGYVNFNSLTHLILDEADRMLDIGFHADILKIVSFLPKNRQTLMFSATMPKKIRELSKRLLKDPAEISLAISKPVEGVTQLAYMASDEQKTKLLRLLLKEREDYKSIIIFSATRSNVSKIVRSLSRKGFAVEGISSDLEQSEREAVLDRFKAKQTRIIVATDVISRGIDIKGIDLVVNFSVPKDAEDYVHRIGRTARAASKGEAITFISAQEIIGFHKIEKLIERKLDKLQPKEELGPGPEWVEPKPRKKKKKYFHKKGNKPKGNFRKKGPVNANSKGNKGVSSSAK